MTLTERDVASPLSAWDRVKLARHPQRPHTLDYVSELMEDFVELHGDRTYGDDQALVGGLARFGERTVLILGHQKGTNTRENISHNFGMPRPEGYRKAERLLRHAAKFGMPVVTFIDTPGADPGIGSEERGQATAIAQSLMTMAELTVPVVAVVIGEGGSGGALAIGVANRILMLENAIYAVASPEGCAAILWKDAAKAPEAAETMRITAHELHRFRIVDDVIAEPVPAHEQPRETMLAVGRALTRHLDELDAVLFSGNARGPDQIREDRHTKFRRIGAWREEIRREGGLPAELIIP
ncbi:MAG TPA: acetyl-CoA carboxylase carboxyltransferase subunit alpha [Thermomicrobiales bacterium]|nr:acetyl-CoA carboxylase carboxyltransferase subunit alpha [Thermomicrobiales bacterium]